jgi:hypothetical protein
MVVTHFFNFQTKEISSSGGVVAELLPKFSSWVAASSDVVADWVAKLFGRVALLLPRLFSLLPDGSSRRDNSATRSPK